MEFTPPSNPLIQQPTPISSIPSSRKLPIKRKPSNLILTTPSPFTDDDDDDDDVISRQSPFKFHRIWTEPDEIRLLQGLLDSSNQGLLFPRDLGIFYARFSGQMSQVYSKSQFSEKLRRLRKKFRVISSRISKGLDKDLLSPQDRALYDLSKQLWDPDVTNSNRKPVDNRSCKANSIESKVSFSPSLPSSSMAVLALPSVVKKLSNSDDSNGISNLSGGYGGNGDGYVKVNDENVELKHNVENLQNEVRVKSSEVVHFATKTLADVIGQSMKEIRMMIDVRGLNLEKDAGFEKRWRDQYVAEFDVLSKRLKLIVEHSSEVSK